MKLERVKCKPLDRAKNLCVSRSYIVGCTGKKAVIIDKQLNHIHTVEGLEYVYSAEVSPDETKLLLISNGNKFYIVDMNTFEKTRITVKAPYNHNLEGRGCWSFDGESVWIPVQRSTDYINSTLRCYCVQDFSKYEDYLADKYYLNGISKIEANNTYFLTGYNRQESNRTYFLYFDGSEFREYPLEASANMIAPTVTINMEKGVITVAAITGCQQFTLDGKAVKTISCHDPEDQEMGVPDALDDITKAEMSSCGSYRYLAAQNGFYLLDANTGAILASVPEEYGIQNFAELNPGLLAIATWTGVKLYRLCNS